MLWSLDIIERLLELYKANRVLWDQKHHNYWEKNVKMLALEGIREELGAPISAKLIDRKYKTMRAAYQVEIRNINAAKLRGFYYKPSLPWFHLFHRFIRETERIKAMENITSDNVIDICVGRRSLPSLNGAPYVIMEDDGEQPVAKKGLKKSRRQIRLECEDSEQTRANVAHGEGSDSDMECSSEDSEDEFQSFANHIAEQLRSMSVHRAVLIQNQIQRIFARNRESEEEEFDNAQSLY